MVWETLNFYKDGGIKGVSGAILTLKNPHAFAPFLTNVIHSTVQHRVVHFLVHS